MKFQRVLPAIGREQRTTNFVCTSVFFFYHHIQVSKKEAIERRSGKYTQNRITGAAVPVHEQRSSATAFFAILGTWYKTVFKLQET